MIGRGAAFVVAFDGLIFDTLPLRASAVSEALSMEGVHLTSPEVIPLVSGRTLAECIRLVYLSRGLEIDETAIDLAGLRAERRYSEAIQQPVSLCPGASDWIQRAAAHSRLLVRADSARRHVDRLMDSAGISMFVSSIHCGDDDRQRSNTSMFTQSWIAIGARLQTLGISEVGVRGLECASETLCSSVKLASVRRVSSVTEIAPDAIRLF